MYENAVLTFTLASSLFSNDGVCGPLNRCGISIAADDIDDELDVDRLSFLLSSSIFLI